MSLIMHCSSVSAVLTKSLNLTVFLLTVHVYEFFFQACADKLKREMDDYGFPPKFPENSEKEEAKQVKGNYNCIII